MIVSFFLLLFVLYIYMCVPLHYFERYAYTYASSVPKGGGDRKKYFAVMCSCVSADGADSPYIMVFCKTVYTLH